MSRKNTYIKKGRGKGVPDDMRMNPLLNQSLFCSRLDEAVNGLRSEPPFLIRAMLSQSVEDRMIRGRPVPGSLQIVFNGKQGPRVQGDSSELLSLADNINDGLVPVGLEIADLEATDFGLS